MRLRWVIRLLLALLGLALAGPAQAQPRPPFAWWKDGPFRKELGLTAEQSNRIEAVFRAALPHLRRQMDELNAQEAELSRLIEGDADDQAIAKETDRVEATRGSLRKTWTLMLVHMRQSLSPGQRVKFKMLREQWDRKHRPRPLRPE